MMHDLKSLYTRDTYTFFHNVVPESTVEMDVCAHLYAGYLNTMELPHNSMHGTSHEMHTYDDFLVCASNRPASLEDAGVDEQEPCRWAPSWPPRSH